MLFIYSLPQLLKPGYLCTKHASGRWSLATNDHKYATGIRNVEFWNLIQPDKYVCMFSLFFSVEVNNDETVMKSSHGFEVLHPKTGQTIFKMPGVRDDMTAPPGDYTTLKATSISASMVGNKFVLCFL